SEAIEADTHAALVHGAVVPAAEEHEVAEPGLTAVGPVDDVMGVGEPAPAAGEPAAAVADLERAPERGRHRAGATPDVEHGAVDVVPHDHPSGVARESPSSYRGNWRAVVEVRAGARVGGCGCAVGRYGPFRAPATPLVRRRLLRERVRLDMQHDLVAPGP